MLALLVSAAAQDLAAHRERVLTYAGRVVDGRGDPVAGAAIDVRAPGALDADAMLAEPAAQTGVDGKFELEARIRLGASADPEPRWLVLAAPGRMTTVVSHFVGWHGSKRVDVGTLALPKGRRLSGRVGDARGDPLAGVHVAAVQRPLSAAGFDPMIVSHRTGGVTDEQGIFALAGAPASGLTLELFKPGYFFRRVHAVTQFTPLQLEMLESGFIAGRVVDADGQPVAARIDVIYECDGAPLDPAMSGDDGRFRVPLLHPTRYRVSAYRDGCAFTVNETLVGPRAGLVVKPDAVGTVLRTEVRARDATTGEPIDEFRAVLVWEWARASAVKAACLDMSTWSRSRAGHVVLSWPASGSKEHRPVVCVIAEGRAWCAEQVSLDERGRPPFSVAVRLEPERVLTGSVVDADSGEAIPGAVVWALPTGAGTLWHSTVPATAVVADPTGRFRLGGLADGRYAVQAYHPDRPVPDEVMVEVGRANAEATLRLGRRAKIRAALVGDLSGRGWQLEARATRAHTSDEKERVAVFFRRVDPPPIALPAQRVELEADPIVHTLSAVRWSNTSAPSRLRFELARLEVRGDQDIQLDLAAACASMLSGTLATEDPLPWERLVLHAVPVKNPHETFGQVGAGSTFPALVGPDGSWSAEVHAGKYTLQVADLATGLVVHVDRTEREVAAGEALRAALTVPLCRAVVDLQTPAAEAVVARELRLVGTSEANTVFAPEMQPTNIGRLPLEYGQRRVDLLLPPKRVELQVLGRDFGGDHVHDRSLGAVTIEPKASELLQVHLEVTGR